MIDEIEEDKVYYDDDLTGIELEQALERKPDDPQKIVTFEKSNKLIEKDLTLLKFLARKKSPDRSSSAETRPSLFTPKTPNPFKVVVNDEEKEKISSSFKKLFKKGREEDCIAPSPSKQRPIGSPVKKGLLNFFAK